MPCNINQRELARHVGEAVTAAGGVALEFNTIAVSDNQSQGTPGMRASLVSREVIADSIELMVHAHDFDGLVCLVGCDKTTPAALMALARVDKPAVVLYSGPMRAGRWRGAAVTIRDVWEAVGAEERGLLTRAELDELERVACPGPGTCAGHFTANTMAVALECLGLARIGDGLIPADDDEAKGAAAEAAAELAVRLVRDGGHRADVPRPPRAAERDGRRRRERRLDERRPAPARDRQRGRRPLTLDELAEIGERTPVLASLTPSGAHTAEEFHRAGGTATLIRELVRSGHIDGAAPTVAGGTLAEATASAPRAGRRGAVRAPHSRSRRAARCTRCAATSRPRAASSRSSGTTRRAPARPGARVRQRGGVRRRRARRASRRPATCSSCATRAPPAARGCARC